MNSKFLLTSFALVTSICCFSQESNKAFAITGGGAGDFQWMNIRQIDLSTGAVIKNIFENGKTAFTLIGNEKNSSLAYASIKKITAEELNNHPEVDLSRALAGKISSLNIQQGNNYQIASNKATGGLVAAAAYDKRNNKLFFTPMSINELRWLDLSSDPENRKFYSLQSVLLMPGKANDEANHITRMTIGADGNGYALTNDGNHLIKFTTGKKIVITDLGALVDAAENKQLSVHNKCSSWGGDVVADASGNLYLFTAMKNIFKISLENRIATYLGSITGLSGAYTLNGAAVGDDESVIISSANTFEGFYKVNMKDLAATKLQTTGPVFNASDLANGNLLFAQEARNAVGAAPLIQREVIGNQFMSIYPNPVFGSQFKITFDNKATGDYQILLTDVQGKILMTRNVFVKAAGQVETINLRSKPANGMYMIKVTNASKRSVFSDKIVIQ